MGFPWRVFYFSLFFSLVDSDAASGAGKECMVAFAVICKGRIRNKIEVLSCLIMFSLSLHETACVFFFVSSLAVAKV